MVGAGGAGSAFGTHESCNYFYASSVPRTGNCTGSTLSPSQYVCPAFANRVTTNTNRARSPRSVGDSRGVCKRIQLIASTSRCAGMLTMDDGKARSKARSRAFLSLFDLVKVFFAIDTKLPNKTIKRQLFSFTSHTAPLRGT